MPQEKYVMEFALAGTGSTGADIVKANTFPVKVKLFSAAFVDDAGITANDTNYATISLELDGNEVASSSTTTTDLDDIAADTPVAIAVTAADAAAASTGKIHAKLVKAASGVAVSGRLICTFVAVRD